MWLSLMLHLCGSFHDLQKHERPIDISKDVEQLKHAAIQKKTMTVS